jgi:hypothetical protein
VFKGQLFIKYDSNGDGFIDLSEGRKISNKPDGDCGTLCSDDKPLDAKNFAAVAKDIVDDGLIDPEEFDKFFGCKEGAACGVPNNSDRAMTEGDAKDQGLTDAEFRKLDKNGDGKIDTDEFHNANDENLPPPRVKVILTVGNNDGKGSEVASKIDKDVGDDSNPLNIEFQDKNNNTVQIPGKDVRVGDNNVADKEKAKKLNEDVKTRESSVKDEFDQKLNPVTNFPTHSPTVSPTTSPTSTPTDSPTIFVAPARSSSSSGGGGMGLVIGAAAGGLILVVIIVLVIMRSRGTAAKSRTPQDSGTTLSFANPVYKDDADGPDAPKDSKNPLYDDLNYDAMPGDGSGAAYYDDFSAENLGGASRVDGDDGYLEVDAEEEANNADSGYDGIDAAIPSYENLEVDAQEEADDTGSGYDGLDTAIPSYVSVWGKNPHPNFYQQNQGVGKKNGSNYNQNLL